MKVAVVVPPIVPEPGLEGHEGVHTVVRQLCSAMATHGLDVVLIMPGTYPARNEHGTVVVDMQRLTSLDEEEAAAAVRKTGPGLSQQFAEVLRQCSVCLVYDLIFDAYFLPSTVALCNAARSTGLRLVFYAFECTWGAERVGGFDWRRLASWPWNEIRRAAQDHTVAFPAAATQARTARITGLDLTDWRLLPPLLDLADEPHLDPAVVSFWHGRDLWNRSPVIFLPALSRENNNIGRAIRITRELKWLGHDPRLLLTFSPSARWDANPGQFLSLSREAERLGLDGEVIFLADMRPAWREGLPRKAVQTAYQLADLVLLPTDWEGFGLVAIEAALARVPLLCTDLPVLREVTDDKADYFSLSDSDGAIAQRVLTLARNPANQARRAARRYFDTGSTYDRYLAPLLAP